MDAADDPIGAPVLPPITVEHCVRSTAGFDVASLIRKVAEQRKDVELLALSERPSWLRLRNEVRFAIRGSEWAVARFWDDVRENLPEHGFRFDNYAPWWDA